MIKKKICLLGYFAVGKTSLTRQFVLGTFSDQYLTTIGVKIDKKEVTLDDEQVMLLIWDIHGEDRFQKVQQSYLIGASGYLLVIDATRDESLKVALDLKKMVETTIGELPFLVLLNKVDLVNEQVLNLQHLVAVGFDPECILFTSAKTGQGVDEAFLKLTKMMI
ncbi:MAG: GTP-binding protein [Prolixibacteraceae bacterium]|nr:GTP-binding protein [Prolixibacteraceae bacterium]